ncbi:MAG TPA: phosphotransferase [Acidobacteriota bacterium]|nr:phosphotransferase [Acidobacteriota bacterium]
MPRVARSLSITEEYPLAQADRLASRFSLPAPLEAYDFPDKGNINQHTYLVFAGSSVPVEYLLQRINQQVFTRPRSVMSAMIACIEAQRDSVAKGGLREGEEWETITLIPTREGTPFLEVTDRRGYSCWRLMIKIPESRTFKSLSEIGDVQERLRIAEEAASGLALYGSFTSGMDTSHLASPLPGYRDTRLYYNQLLSVLAGCRTLEQAEKYLPSDPDVRQSTELHFLIHIPHEEYGRRTGDPGLKPFITLAREQEPFAMTLLEEMKKGGIRRVAIHGDTKLDNFLFSTRTGRVKALVDLDTIMPHTWLVDWGDMVRSLVNVAGEKEQDLDKVRVDMDIFRAVARGFLRSARGLLSREIELMVDAVQIIALELGIRFLADYLRGDSYFKLGPADPPDLNRTRAMVQLTLFEQLRKNAREATSCIDSLRHEFGK